MGGHVLGMFLALWSVTHTRVWITLHTHPLQ